MTERRLLNQILRRVGSGHGLRLFRQNVGTAWTGSQIHQIAGEQLVRVHSGDVVIRQARPLHAGLCRGSSDLIGWQSRQITEHDIGQTIAQFAAVEAKTGRQRPTKHQQRFLDAVEAQGGLAVVARDPEDVRQAIRENGGGDG